MDLLHAIFDSKKGQIVHCLNFRPKIHSAFHVGNCYKHQLGGLLTILFVTNSIRVP